MSNENAATKSEEVKTVSLCLNKFGLGLRLILSVVFDKTWSGETLSLSQGLLCFTPFAWDRNKKTTVPSGGGEGQTVKLQLSYRNRPFNQLHI